MTGTLTFTQWTATLPQAPGFYWMRRASGRPVPVRILHDPTYGLAVWGIGASDSVPLMTYRGEADWRLLPIPD